MDVNHELKNGKIKTTCKCVKKVTDVYKPEENFKFAGCDNENNPFFRCKDCDELVWG